MNSSLVKPVTQSTSKPQKSAHITIHSAQATFKPVLIKPKANPVGYAVTDSIPDASRFLLCFYTWYKRGQRVKVCWINMNAGSGCVLWGPVAGGTGGSEQSGVSLRRAATHRVSYERADKERSEMREREKCRTRGGRPNASSKKTKTEGNRRWEIEERGKQKGGNSNLPTEITWEKCSSEKKRGYDLCQRTSFHATATTGLHYSALQRGRQRKIGVEREKKWALVLFYVLSIEEMTLFMLITDPFHPSEWNDPESQQIQPSGSIYE